MRIQSRQYHHTRRNRLAEILAACVLASLLSVSCLFEEPLTDGPSTETGNPNLAGILKDDKGIPSPGTVKLFRLAKPVPGKADSTALVPPTLVKSAVVAADGKYRFDSLPPALYALEGADAAGKTFSLVPSLELATAKDTLQRHLSLKLPARLLGRVTRGSNPLPAGVLGDEKILVRLGGADRFAESDSAGRFALDNVPEGIYRIAFAAQDGHYEPAFLDTVRAIAGGTRELPLVELAWSRFQAPPAPPGLTALADSATSNVRLSWRPVKVANLAGYELIRLTEGAVKEDTLYRGGDTAWTDTGLADLKAGDKFTYRVVAVNALGNRSAAVAGGDRIVTVPAMPDTSGPGTGYLSGRVQSKSLPVALAKVRLYAIPAAPGSPDSLPLPARLLDSAVTGSQGEYRFRNLMPGTYTVWAENPVAGEGAIRIGLAPRGDSTRLDTLALLATGSVEGMVSRDSLWVTINDKGDGNIPVSLAGAPFKTTTGFGFDRNGEGAPFTITGIPAGTYKLVAYAVPYGYFLPDTFEVKVLAGKNTLLPTIIKARYNPSAPPPKIVSLKIDASTRAAVSLSWNPYSLRNYPLLKGYRILRLDGALRETARSGVLSAAGYKDDISQVASGTRVFYGVRVVDTSGREGLNGGDFSGQPIPFTVP
ncbi:MAG: hypothetical protein M3Y08_03500 [Fibrobacterota bacterium]|nr:hypothetical protein [Fibrobacterota bacterium]